VSAEKFTPKDIARNFGEECTTLLLALGTPMVPLLINSIDAKIPFIASLAAGAATTVASFAVGKIMNRPIIVENDLPSKPLAAQNPAPVKVPRLRSVRIAA
jgi:hypothetical protein